MSVRYLVVFKTTSYGFSISDSITLLSKQKQWSHAWGTFKAGSWEIADLEEAKRFGDMVNEVSEYYEHTRKPLTNALSLECS